LARFEFESGIGLFCFSFTFVSFGESCLLVSWCAGGRCSMACNNEDRGRSRRHGAEDRGWSDRSGTQWWGDRVVGWRCVSIALGGQSLSLSLSPYSLSIAYPFKMRRSTFSLASNLANSEVLPLIYS
jgi:hypothetical protein